MARLAGRGARAWRRDVPRAGLIQVGDTELRYDKLVLSTGSSPAIPPLDGLEEVDYWTNVDATETLEVPARLVVLGAGPVGCELAQFFQRVGSQVTLVQGDSRILSRVDADAAALVATALQEDGVEIRLDARASRVTPSALILEDGGELPFDRLLIATGRRPNVAGPRGARADDVAPWHRGRRAHARRARTSGRSAT